MSRVTTRVIEICQVSMEKGKNYDAGVNAEYNSFKGKLMESLNNNNQKINVY